MKTHINSPRTWSGALITAAILALMTPAQAQLGGMLKRTGLTAKATGGGVEVAQLEGDLSGKFSPVADTLKEAADLYVKALDLKIQDNSQAAAKESTLPQALSKMDYVRGVGKEVAKAGSNPDKVNMSPEQKETLKKAHQKLLEGGGQFVAVAGPTALAIKGVTDQDPTALVAHPGLVKLGVVCTRDAGTLVSFLKYSRDLAKAKAIDVKADGEFSPPKS